MRGAAATPAKVSEYAGSDADTCRRQAGRDEGLNESGRRREEQMRDDPRRDEGAADAAHCDEKRSGAELLHLSDCGLEAGLEHQDNDRHARDGVDPGIGLEEFQTVYSEEGQAADHKASGEFSEHGRLTEPRCDESSRPRGRDHDCDGRDGRDVAHERPDRTRGLVAVAYFRVP